MIHSFKLSRSQKLDLANRYSQWVLSVPPTLARGATDGGFCAPWPPLFPLIQSASACMRAYVAGAHLLRRELRGSGERRRAWGSGGCGGKGGLVAWAAFAAFSPSGSACRAAAVPPKGGGLSLVLLSGPSGPSSAKAA